MKFNPASASTSASAPRPGAPPLESERDQISQNIEAVLEFYTREEQNISRSQRILERVSGFIGRGLHSVLYAPWIIATVALRRFGILDFDPPPFFWLQGIVGLGAMLIATAVLSKQNRLAKLAE